MSSRLKILVADDEPIARLLVVRALRDEFDICEAADGDAAVAAFSEHQPDVVLLDVEMPGRDGVATAAEIKRLAGERFVPVFLVSGAEGIPTLARGLAAGADDFLPKPFDVRVFRPKLQVFLRLRAQHERITAQNRILDRYHRETEIEHALAGQIFRRLAGRVDDALDARVLQHSLATEFSGDALLAAVCPSGAQRYLVADVTGHGLNAALVTLPLTSLFYFSTARGDSLGFTLERISAELHEALPPSLFVSVVALEVDTAGRLLVLNAGMPPVYVKHAGGVAEYESTNLPLGITGSWVPSIDSRQLEPGDSVFALSDGLVERADASGERFGAGRGRQLIEAPAGVDGFDALVTAMTEFAPGQDDVTLLSFHAGSGAPRVVRPTPLPGRDPAGSDAQSLEARNAHSDGA